MKRLRWTASDYFLLADTGLLDGRRFELIDGDLLTCRAQDGEHMAAVTRIGRLLLGQLTDATWVVIRGTLILARHDAPDPDFHVFDVPPGTPDEQLPTPILVIEVSDTTYLKDSGPKLQTYAGAGVPDYWIVNLLQDRVEVYRQPQNSTGKRSGWRYAEVRQYGRGSEISPLRWPRVSFSVDKMLP